MKIRLTTLAAAILASYALPGLAQSDPFIEKILNEHYPENAQATANDNSGSYGFCENEEKSEEERAACRKDIQKLSATLATRPDLGAANDAYPPEIRVSGEAQGGKKQYNDQPFIFKYDGKKHRYIRPKDYPMAAKL